MAALLFPERCGILRCLGPGLSRSARGAARAAAGGRRCPGPFGLVPQSEHRFPRREVVSQLLVLLLLCRSTRLIQNLGPLFYRAAKCFMQQSVLLSGEEGGVRLLHGWCEGLCRLRSALLFIWEDLFAAMAARSCLFSHFQLVDQKSAGLWRRETFQIHIYNYLIFCLHRNSV